MKITKAIAVFKNPIQGDVIFTQCPNCKKVQIEINLKGFQSITPKKIGFHVHKFGNISTCKTAGPHFDSGNRHHGNINDKIRHTGDLGNIIIKNKKCKMILEDNIISLNGKNSIIGRTLMIHEKTDDLGRGGLHPYNRKIRKESLTTGNAGGRHSCAVIGILEES